MTLDGPPRTGTGAERWTGLYCHLHWTDEQVDRFLVETVAPLMDGLHTAGRITSWFFIRYAEQGPHLRIRARDADPATVEHWRAALSDAISAAPYPPLSFDPAVMSTWHPHGAIRQVTYEPEVSRYGGPAALPVAEELFEHSSRIAAGVVARTPQRGQRMVAATDLILATAVALDFDPLGAARWLRRSAISWRWHRDAVALDPSTVQNPARSTAVSQSAAVVRRWREISASEATGTRLRDRWAARVRSARAALEGESGGPVETWLGVWSSQLHMLLNRLGILPDEERALYFFIAGALLAPHAPDDFFVDGATGTDRRYLEASRYQRARIEEQAPRRLRTPDTNWFPPAGPAVSLPYPGPVDTPLGEALAKRASAHGDLGGKVDTDDLGTLIWSALTRPGPTGPGFHRPYPSAGAKYAARLRVIARDVAGLAPGYYAADPATRTLVPIGPTPDDTELVSTCMWFAQEPSSEWNGPPQHQPIIMSTLPVLLVVYVDLRAIRASYGLRALRFALLEAGHLAQNLALTAAATGLAMGTCGGFYDDIANEVLLLDGVDEVLAYLLPVGRPAP
jgi:thiopeptide-type bacteriocin biosynthesis protein